MELGRLHVSQISGSIFVIRQKCVLFVQTIVTLVSDISLSPFSCKYTLLRILRSLVLHFSIFCPIDFIVASRLSLEPRNKTVALTQNYLKMCSKPFLVVRGSLKQIVLFAIQRQWNVYTQHFVWKRSVLRGDLHTDAYVPSALMHFQEQPASTTSDDQLTPAT